MVARGILLLALACTAQEREERGKFRLSAAGQPVGTEEYRLESFEDGKVVLFAKARYDLLLPSGKREHLIDTVLTMEKTLAPALYAGYRKAGREEDQVKIQWDRGTAVSPRKRVRSAADYLLDPSVVSHLIPILRQAEPGTRKLKVFNPNTMGDFEVILEDKGEVLLRGPTASVKVREILVGLGYITTVAHVDEKKRLLRAWSAASGTLAEFDGYEGWAPEAVSAVAMEETEVTFASGDATLAGTLSRPKGGKSAPAVVLLSDEGPHDRNGAGPQPVPALVRALVQALVADGVAVLRFDDRGCGGSGGDFGMAKVSDLAADARAAVAFLRTRGDVDAVGLAGLGEGALVACVAAAQDEEVRGLILLQMPGATVDRILLKGVERELRAQGTKEEAAEAILKGQRERFDRVKASTDDYLMIDEQRTYVAALRERILLDPAAALGKLKVPVVLCFGRAPAEDVAALRAAKPDAEWKAYDGVDAAFTGGAGRVDDGFLKFVAERAARLAR